MKGVLIDTSVWSHYLRRKTGKADEELVSEVSQLIRGRLARIIGPIRQETLAGIREPVLFAKVRDGLRVIDDDPLVQGDFEYAAELSNECRARGIQGSVVDLLICAIAIDRDWEIFTEDEDFTQYRRVIPIRLHRHSQLQ